MHPGRDVEEWLDRFRPILIRRARCKGLQSGEAEDLAQEVCLACIAGADREQGVQEFEAWVHGVFKNLLADHWKMRRRSPSLLADIESVLRQTPPGSQGAREPGSQGAREWLRESAGEIRERLRPAWRTVFDLMMQDVGTGAISRELGIPKERVREIRRSIALRIRKAILRKKLPPL